MFVNGTFTKSTPSEDLERGRERGKGKGKGKGRGRERGRERGRGILMIGYLCNNISTHQSTWEGE